MNAPEIKRTRRQQNGTAPPAVHRHHRDPPGNRGTPDPPTALRRRGHRDARTEPLRHLRETDGTPPTLRDRGVPATRHSTRQQSHGAFRHRGGSRCVPLVAHQGVRATWMPGARLRAHDEPCAPAYHTAGRLGDQQGDTVRRPPIRRLLQRCLPTHGDPLRRTLPCGSGRHRGLPTDLLPLHRAQSGARRFGG